MSLPNANINEHPQGDPKLGDFGIYYDSADGVTKKFPMSMILTSDIDNFEWSSVSAAAGDYDIGDVVTRLGKWWQSTINNNATQPGVDPLDTDWTLLTISYSWQYWVMGLFIETDVFVLRNVNGRAYIYQLVSATRPYPSSNLEDEIDAGDWKFVAGPYQIVETDTSADVELDMDLLESIGFISSDIINSNRDLSIINDLLGKDINWMFEVDADGRILNVATNITMSTEDGNWEKVARTWTSPQPGKYKAKLEYDLTDNLWYMEIKGPFKNS